MSEEQKHGENNDEQPVTFTPEQQVKIDEIIKSAMGRAAAEVRREKSVLEKQLAHLNEQLETAKSSAGSQSDLQNQFTEMQRKLQEKENAISVVKEENEKLAKAQLVAQHCADVFVDLGAVSAMTDRNIRRNPDTGRFEVLNVDGSLKLSPTTFQPMSVQEFYQSFAEEKPYLVKSTAKGGNGSTASSQSSLSSGRGQYEPEQIFGKKSNARLANELAKQNPAEYKRLRTLAIKKKLL